MLMFLHDWLVVDRYCWLVFQGASIRGESAHCSRESGASRANGFQHLMGSCRRRGKGSINVCLGFCSLPSIFERAGTVWY